MKASCIFISVFTTICSLSIIVNSQTDSCSSNLNLNGVPFDTTSLQCQSVWSAQSYILRYAQTSSNLWSFVLSAPDANCWVAIGFSSNGQMVGSSAVVGWASSNTSVIKQYYLGGQTSSQVIEGQGSLVINSSAIISQSSRLYLAFQLVTTQPSSQLLYAIGPTGVLPVAPSYSLTQHQDEVATVINYVTGQTSQQGAPYTKLRRSHGLLNMLGWGILIIIGAIIARYFKHWDPMWFYVHTCIQSAGFALGIAGVITGLVLEHRLGAHVSTHKGIGILVLVLGCLQVMAILARPNKTSKVRKYWNWYHYGVGRSLMIFAIANVFYGIHLGNEGHGWNAGYGVALAVLFVISVVLEIRMWRTF